MKKIFRLVFGIVIILMLLVYVPQFFHVCKDCETFFVGSGYEQNIFVGAVMNDNGVLCKNCAEKQHSLSITLGKSLNDYKKSVELNPLTVIQQWIDD